MTESRQPVHTVFGGAHLFRADIVERFQSVALLSLTAFAPDAAPGGDCWAGTTPANVPIMHAVRASVHPARIIDGLRAGR